MQQDILPTTRRAIERASFVSINRSAIETFCDAFSPGNVATVELGSPNELNLAESIGLVCVFNCVNFCFWGSKREKKWAATVSGHAIDGATGLFCALEEALKNAAPLLDPNFLSELRKEEFNKLLKGNIEIPLLDERVKNLREAGDVLLKKFGGSFMNVLEAAKGDAVELTNLFITRFPSFDDYAILEGAKIEFHKRAQLNADMINYRLAKRGEKQLSNLEKLTAFADYKVPQMLEKFGILEYAPELTATIASYREIPAGSQEEVEIRAATIWAIEEMKQTLLPRFPEVTARQLDDHLWSLGQTKSPDDKPYHRTKTIAY